jgi:hypothetical protein
MRKIKVFTYLKMSKKLVEAGKKRRAEMPGGNKGKRGKDAEIQLQERIEKIGQRADRESAGVDILHDHRRSVNHKIGFHTVKLG